MSLLFPDPIEIRDAGMHDGSRVFALIKPFRYISSIGTIHVPAGFLTDGASVPRVFWSIFDPFGPYFHAALVHDFLYSRQSSERYDLDRAEADEIFKEAMFNIGIGWATRETIYHAVRLFGWRNFKRK
jgi:hypothetical protein